MTNKEMAKAIEKKLHGFDEVETMISEMVDEFIAENGLLSDERNRVVNSLANYFIMEAMKQKTFTFFGSVDKSFKVTKKQLKAALNSCVILDVDYEGRWCW